MKKVSWIVVITGAAVGLAAIVLTLLGLILPIIKKNQDAKAQAN